MKRIVMALAGGGGVPTVNRRMTAPCDVGIYAGRDLPFRHPRAGHVTGDGASAYGMACIPSINENLKSDRHEQGERMSINAIAWANDSKPAGPVEKPTLIGPARHTAANGTTRH